MNAKTKRLLFSYTQIDYDATSIPSIPSSSMQETRAIKLIPLMASLFPTNQSKRYSNGAAADHHNQWFPLRRSWLSIGIRQHLRIRIHPWIIASRTEQPSLMPLRSLRRTDLRHLLHFPSQTQPAQVPSIVP